MKILVKLVVLVVVLVVGAVIAGFIYVDAIAKAAIEKGGTYALGVPTTVDSADVGVFGGTFKMLGLNIENPDGFDTPQFMRLNDAGVAVSLASLRQEVVTLPLLGFDGLDLYLERAGDKSNYDVILANLKRFESPDASDPQPAPPSEDGKRFIIEKLDIRNVKIHADVAPLGGEGVKVTVPIDEITLENVGSDTGKGVLLGELASILVKALMDAAVENGGGLIPAEMLGDLKGQLAQLDSLQDMGIGMASSLQADAMEKANTALQQAGENVNKAVGDLGEGADKAMKNVGEEADKALKGLGGLIGGGGKDKDGG